MKNRIFKTTLALGLISFSLLAIAEGKYTAKFPLNGVSANPTFGMTATDKKDYEENSANIKMCATESRTYEEEIYYVSEEVEIGGAWDGPHYNVTSGNRYYLQSQNPPYSNILYWDGVQGYTWVSDVPFVNGRTYTRSGNTYRISECYKYDSKRCSVSKWVMQTEIQEIEKTRMVENKTSNYDWCVANGYQTQ